MIEPAKQRFLLDKPRAERLRNLFASKDFSDACDAALAHMISDTSIADANSAAACGFRMEGATRFLRVLSSIADPIIEPKPYAGGNLKQ